MSFQHALYFDPAVSSCDTLPMNYCEHCSALWYWTASLRSFLMWTVERNNKSLPGRVQIKKNCMDELLSDGFISKEDIAVRCSKQPVLMFLIRGLEMVTTWDLLWGGKCGFWDYRGQNSFCLYAAHLHVCVRLCKTETDRNRGWVWECLRMH